jgi:hypothetical protein
MAGDSVRDLFRDRLATHISASAGGLPAPWGSLPIGSVPAGLGIPIVDLVNTAEAPDASQLFVALEFGARDEQQFTFGAPLANLHREDGMAFVRACARLGKGRDAAETLVEALRARFRADRFGPAGFEIRITGTTLMAGGMDEGGLWIESLALRFTNFNRG